MNIRKFNLEFYQSFLVRGVGALSMLLLTLTITNSLSTFESGIILQIFSLNIALSLLSRMGSEKSLIKYLRDWRRVNFGRYFLSWTVKKSIILGLILVFFYFSSIFFWGNVKDLYYMSSLFYFLPVFNILNIKATFYQARDQVLRSILIKNVYPFLGTAILSSMYILFTGKITGSLFLIFYALIITIVAFNDKEFLEIIFKEFKLLSPVRNRICRNISSNYISLSLFIAVQTWAVIILSLYFLQKSDIGLINVIFRIGNVLSFVLIAINSIYTQRIASSILVGDYFITKKIYHKAFKESALLAIPMFIFLVLFSSHILSFFNDYYKDYFYLLIIILCGQIVNVLTGPVLAVFVMSPKFYQKSEYLLHYSILIFILAGFILNFFEVLGGVLFQSLILIIPNLILLYYVRRIFLQKTTKNTLNV